MRHHKPPYANVRRTKSSQLAILLGTTVDAFLIAYIISDNFWTALVYATVAFNLVGASLLNKPSNTPPV